MTTTITNGTDVLEPILVLGYRTGRPSRNVEHDILDRADPDISFQPAGTRKGTLELLFDTEAAAEEAELLHAAIATWTISDPERTTVAMSYVLAQGGELERELDDDTRNVWIVRVPFREVLP